MDHEHEFPEVTCPFSDDCPESIRGGHVTFMVGRGRLLIRVDLPDTYRAEDAEWARDWVRTFVASLDHPAIDLASMRSSGVISKN